MSFNSTISINDLPKVNIERSIFKQQYKHKTSFNIGELIPFYVKEIIPGSTYSLRTSIVARLQTLKTPIMDDILADVSYYFIPDRLLDEHWKNIVSENDEGPWIMDKVDYRVPHLEYPGTRADNKVGFDTGSLADYMGIPINIGDTAFQQIEDADKPMVYPFRAYALVVNEFYLDKNLQQPIQIHKDSVNRTGKTRAEAENNPEWYVTDLELGGKPFVAGRLHDYFSSCLPAPQRSPDVSIFGGFNTGENFNQANGNGPFAPVVTRPEYTIGGNSNPPYGFTALQGYKAGGDVIDVAKARITVNNSNVLAYGSLAGDSTANQYGFVPSNLWASLNIPEATISNLRLAFQTQRYFEKLAVGGSRYRDWLQEFFGVTNGDARMQVPEYLGGHRFPVSIHQVANQAQSENNSLGELGAMSNTIDVHDDVHMSFSEHGFVLGLICLRFPNTYSQGLEKFWSRRQILDFYNPVFARISMQPVYTRQISLGVPEEWPDDGPVVPQTANRVFGYRPAWDEYRMNVSRCSGEMRPEAENSLANWHLADDYRTAPYLGSDWIMTDKTTVDRVLDVTSQIANQVFCDICVNEKAVLPMPVTSMPGLADHF